MGPDVLSQAAAWADAYLAAFAAAGGFKIVTSDQVSARGKASISSSSFTTRERHAKRTQSHITATCSAHRASA